MRLPPTCTECVADVWVLFGRTGNRTWCQECWNFKNTSNMRFGRILDIAERHLRAWPGKARCDCTRTESIETRSRCERNHVSNLSHAACRSATVVSILTRWECEKRGEREAIQQHASELLSAKGSLVRCQYLCPWWYLQIRWFSQTWSFNIYQHMWN